VPATGSLGRKRQLAVNIIPKNGKIGFNLIFYKIGGFALLNLLFRKELPIFDAMKKLFGCPMGCRASVFYLFFFRG
jgi:hypothetical protein